MRNLQTRDVFAMARLITSLNLKDELKKITDNVDKNSNVNDIGYEVIFTVFSKCTDEDSENKIYKFLAGPLEIKAEEVAVLDPVELAEKILQISNLEKWKSFLSKASQLIK
jgi:hypothetical protein